MKTLKWWAMRTWDLVQREDYDRIWKKWSEGVTSNLFILKGLGESYKGLARAHEIAVKDLAQLRENCTQAMLALAMQDVAPLESMNRALEWLTASDHPNQIQVDKAISELRNALNALREKKGVTHVK